MQIIPLFIALGAGLAATGASATENRQLRENVQRSLREFHLPYDAGDLTNHQLVEVYSIAHSRRSQSDKRQLIRSAIDGAGRRFLGRVLGGG